MSLTNPNTPVSQQDLQDFYHKLLPYMGGSFGMIANKFKKGDLYSTDEKMIGQWIDDKPLYQKVVNCGTLPNKTTKTIDTGLTSDVHAVRLFECYARRPSDGYVLRMGTVSSTSSLGNNDMVTVQTVNNNLAVYIVTGADRSTFTETFAVLEYTKTTDSAISIGDDTDYSTEEKIVGTWIDGKPIFQRTVQMTLPAKDSDTTLNVSSWNINLVVSCQGTSASMQSAPMTTYVGNSNYHYHCFVNMPNKLLYVRNLGSTLGVGDVGYVTVQYTKTS